MVSVESENCVRVYRCIDCRVTTYVFISQKNTVPTCHSYNNTMVTDNLTDKEKKCFLKYIRRFFDILRKI